MLGLTHILLAVLTVLAGATAMALAESASATATTTMASRHDYKLTLKRPFLYSDNKTIPFYERFGGNHRRGLVSRCHRSYILIPLKRAHVAALPTDEYVLLTPSAPRLKGAVWSKKTNPHKEWMVHL